MVVVGDCRGWDQETHLLFAFRDYPGRFPQLPKRRRRDLMGTLNRLRQHLLDQFDLALDRQCVIASLPIPVPGFHRLPHPATPLPLLLSAQRGATVREGEAAASRCEGKLSDSRPDRIHLQL